MAINISVPWVHPQGSDDIFNVEQEHRPTRYSNELYPIRLPLLLVSLHRLQHYVALQGMLQVSVHCFS